MPSLLAQPFSWLISNLASLYDTLTAPASWSEFANDHAFHLLVLVFQAAKKLNIPYNGTYHIPSGDVGPGPDEPNPSQNPTDHAFEAITGADDFVDIENHVTMKDVLNEIVDVTQTVTSACE